MLDIIHKHFADFSAGNWDAYKAALADNVTYEEVATNTRVQGLAAYLPAVQRWKRAFPDLKATVKDVLISGDKAVVELEWEGTHGGPLEGPFGTLAATNKKGRIRAVAVLTIANDKIVENRHYFDLFAIMSQLELLPGLGAPAAGVQPAAAPKH